MVGIRELVLLQGAIGRERRVWETRRAGCQQVPAQQAVLSGNNCLRSRQSEQCESIGC